MKKSLLPLLVFVVLVLFLGLGLKLNPREVPSPLIGKPAPVFTLPRIHASEQVFSSEGLHGKVWLLNVWASWCGACRQEHPVLDGLAHSGVVPIYGLNYKDQQHLALAWLREFGDPYQESFFDSEGRVGINFGVYGVPETFLIDKTGTIRFKHAGPVTPKLLNETILPMIRELNG